MRNQEAARYARWAAVTAAAIALVVAGVYSRRAIQAARARRSAPVSVPATVQQQSAEFKFTKMEQDRAVFTIRASTATRFKDEDRSLLKDVWITIYGRAGDRNDNIHTRECSYEPKSGEVHCAGNVEIDIQGANPASGKPADKQLQVTTSNLSFNRDTGEASTPEKVEFQSPQGHGSAMGVSYSSQTAVVRLEHNVAIEMIPADGNADKAPKQSSDRSSVLATGVPVSATGSSLELRRNERLVVLNGPAVMKQGARELSAEKISMELDSTFHAQHLIAEGHPVVKSSENGATMNVAAEKFEGFLSPAGWMQRIVAAGNVNGSRTAKTGTDHFTAAQVEIAMQPERNLVREMTVKGGVTMDSRQDGASRSLKTEALLVKFGAGAQPDQQKIESAETLAPATIDTKTTDETTQLRAKKFVTQFGPDRPPRETHRALSRRGTARNRQECAAGEFVGRACCDLRCERRVGDARSERQRPLSAGGQTRHSATSQNRPDHRPNRAARFTRHIGCDEPHLGGQRHHQPEVRRHHRDGQRDLHVFFIHTIRRRESRQQGRRIFLRTHSPVRRPRDMCSTQVEPDCGRANRC